MKRPNSFSNIETGEYKIKSSHGKKNQEYIKVTI